jgi:hypothetical protein
MGGYSAGGVGRSCSGERVVEALGMASSDPVDLRHQAAVRVAAADLLGPHMDYCQSPLGV